MANLRSFGSGLAACVCLFPTFLLGCTGGIGQSTMETDHVDDDNGPTELPKGSVVPPPAFAPPAPSLRRLTNLEFANSIQHLLGVQVKDTDFLQPDNVVAHYASVGAGSAELGESGVEKAEALARGLVDQVFASASARARFVGCEAADAPCVESFIRGFGRRAFRRPLQDAERNRYVGLAKDTAALLADPWRGLAMATAAMLQSPKFLYRAELGEPSNDQPKLRAFSSWDMAARLSFFLWASTPDDELLDAAAKDELLQPQALRRQTDRLLESPRARTAAAKFFRELMDVDGAQLAKDTTVFPKATPGLWNSIQREVEQLMLDAAFGEKADIRRAFDGQDAYVDAKLAELYGLKSTRKEGDLERLSHDKAGPRVGILTTAGFLAQHGIPERGSPVIRGLFIRETLLCAHIPAPPETLDIALKPPPSAKTTRQKLAQHATDPSCAGCHEMMDELGFAFESFDGLGAHRTTENGEPVDTTGSLDGKPFTDAKSLVTLLLAHEDFDRCLVTQLYRSATGRMENEGDEVPISDLTRVLQQDGYAWQGVMRALTTNPGFRYAGKAL